MDGRAFDIYQVRFAGKAQFTPPEASGHRRVSNRAGRAFFGFNLIGVLAQSIDLTNNQKER
ncbi:hypothetical protein ACVWZP_001230 [Pseudomonas sp. TE36184]